MPAHPRTLALLLLATLCTIAKADDGAASIAAGGIVMKHEPRITMQKEVLRISATKVQVDYEFRNDTNTDITTEVAFPVPGYKLDWDERSIKEQSFDDFQLTVENQLVHFEVEIKATLKGRDVSAQLKKYGIDIGTFGHYNEEAFNAPDIQKLSPAQKSALVHAGLIDLDTFSRYLPGWTVEKKYYWLQTFPAHAIVHISHEYTPVLGNSNTIGLGPTPKQDSFEAKSVCIDPSLRNQLSKLAANPENEVSISYVDFILTTANTWKTPIEDFTLIVERTDPKDTVSFCWDGPVEKLDANKFQAHANNLIPTKELHIGFYHLDTRFN